METQDFVEKHQAAISDMMDVLNDHNPFAVTGIKDGEIYWMLIKTVKVMSVEEAREKIEA
jgi:hypothetical protein